MPAISPATAAGKSSRPQYAPPGLEGGNETPDKNQSTYSVLHRRLLDDCMCDSKLGTRVAGYTARELLTHDDLPIATGILSHYVLCQADKHKSNRMQHIEKALKLFQELEDDGQDYDEAKEVFIKARERMLEKQARKSKKKEMKQKDQEMEDDEADKDDISEFSDLEVTEAITGDDEDEDEEWLVV